MNETIREQETKHHSVIKNILGTGIFCFPRELIFQFFIFLVEHRPHKGWKYGAVVF